MTCQPGLLTAGSGVQTSQCHRACQTHNSIGSCWVRVGYGVARAAHFPSPGGSLGPRV